MKDHLYFVGSTYMATGEGMTIAVLATLAMPRTDRDYKVKPGFVNGEFQEGELLYPRGEIALIEFEEIFGAWLARGANVYNHSMFMCRYSEMVTPGVAAMFEKPAGNFKWFTHLHVNYS